MLKKHSLTKPICIAAQGAYLDYVGAPLAAANRYGKENPMAAGYQAGQEFPLKVLISKMRTVINCDKYETLLFLGLPYFQKMGCLVKKKMR